MYTTAQFAQCRSDYVICFLPTITSYFLGSDQSMWYSNANIQLHFITQTIE